MTSKRNIAVFIASPNDVNEERKEFREAIVQLNAGFGASEGIYFEPLGWEDVLATTGHRVQGLFNDLIDRCDVFILIMHRRWGQETTNAQPFSSFTEEEFHRAQTRFRLENNPKIFVFFKRIEAPFEHNQDDQLKKVLNFKRELESTNIILYREIDENKGSFIKEIYQHLIKFANGGYDNYNPELEHVLLPIYATDAIKSAKREITEHLENNEALRFKIDLLHLESAETAAQLSKNGFLEQAKAKFINLIDESENIKILYLAYTFFHRIGDFTTAINILERWFNLSGEIKRTTNESSATYYDLGLLYLLRGKFDSAELMYKKSFHINYILENKTSLAKICSKLGELYRIQNRFVRALRFFKKAINYDDLNYDKESMQCRADNYQNIGKIYRKLDDFELAKSMFNNSLLIYEELKDKNSMSIIYGELGSTYFSYNDFILAKKLLKKALKIGNSIHNNEVKASAYGNLGNIYLLEKKYKLAETNLKKSSKFEELLGHKEGMAENYGMLGNLFFLQNRLNDAESMYIRSLTMYELLHNLEGMKIQHMHLTSLYQHLNNPEKSRIHQDKSLELTKLIPNIPSKEYKLAIMTIDSQ